MQCPLPKIAVKEHKIDSPQQNMVSCDRSITSRSGPLHRRLHLSTLKTPKLGKLFKVARNQEVVLAHWISFTASSARKREVGRLLHHVGSKEASSGPSASPCRERRSDKRVVLALAASTGNSSFLSSCCLFFFSNTLNCTSLIINLTLNHSPNHVMSFGKLNKCGLAWNICHLLIGSSWHLHVKMVLPSSPEQSPLKIGGRENSLEAAKWQDFPLNCSQILYL